MRDIKSIFAKYPNDFLSKKYIIEIELKSQTMRLYKNYELIEEYKSFDIIIDDGGHTMNQQIQGSSTPCRFLD